MVGTPIIMQIDPDMMPVMIASADVDGMDQAEVSDYVDNELLPLLESRKQTAAMADCSCVPNACLHSRRKSPV